MKVEEVLEPNANVLEKEGEDNLLNLEEEEEDSSKNLLNFIKVEEEEGSVDSSKNEE